MEDNQQQQSIIRIVNAFDSHLHLLATGQVKNQLDLTKVNQISDLKDILKRFHENQSSKNNINKNDLENKNLSQWIIGFGWNENEFKDGQIPSLHDLDLIENTRPLILSRIDGHASLINSVGLNQLKQMGFDENDELYTVNEILKDESGKLKGHFKDRAHIDILKLINQSHVQNIEDALLIAGSILNQAGFTHVRDMSMSFNQWKIQKKITENNQLKLYTEGYITAENVEDLPRAWEEFQQCLETPCEFLKIKGLKIFIDGSLGSETAYLSQNYLNQNHAGILLWNTENIKEAIRFCWSRKVEIAVHTIGDQAVHDLAICARAVSAEGFLGVLNIEHAQLFRKETFNLLKPLHIKIHMQPCHWLSDHQWLSSKIGALEKHLFQWEFFRKNNICLTFGSDSPIEPSSFVRNITALNQIKMSKKKQPEAFQGDMFFYHSYLNYNKNISWGDAYTDVIVNHQNIPIKYKVYFKSECIHEEIVNTIII